MQMQPFHMQKRISHKPKTYLLKIEPIEETVQEDKALELVHDGIVLTKEMMDQIEVSDSDEVEVEPKEEEKVEKKEAEVGDDSSEAEVFEYVKPVQVQDTVRKYAVLDILNATGEPVEITLDRTIFRKRDTNVSRFRLEMNKMAWSNVDEVIKTIRKIRLDKHEMKACAEIFFEKAVTEQTFCVLYAYAINILREYYYNRELADKEKAFNAAILAPIYNEKGEQIFEAIPDDLNSNRGYLFNVMLEHLGKTIKTFKTWKYDPTGMSNEEADEALISSNNYKDRIFGAFRFATILGLNQVVNEEIIRIALEGLIERGIQDEEAEIAGIVLKMCANELYMLYPTMFDTMIDELKAYIPRSQDNKVKYNTMMIIDEMLKIKQNGGGEKSAYLEKRIKGGDLTCEKRELYDTNATERLQFKRGLKSKDAKTYERKQRTERRPETKEHKKDLIVNNPFNGLQSTGSEKLNGEEIKYVHDITEELHFYSDEDKEQTLEDIQNDIKAKKISNSSLVAAFIYNAVKDKEMKLIIEYCMKCIKTLRLNTELVNIGVKRASMSLEDLIVDFPKARENFEYACCSFMSKGLMDLSDFKQYDIDAAYIEKFGESLDEIARQKFVE